MTERALATTYSDYVSPERDEGMAKAEAAADARVLALIGARVRAAATRRPREMVCVGRVPSNLKSTHAHEIKVWIGAEHAEAVAS